MSTLPALFVSHGAPTLALDPGATGQALAAIAGELPRPRAVLAVSAHWITREPALTTGAQPETIHDFYGFPEPLYALRYPAPGAPELAARALQALTGAGAPAHGDPARGLDHGAWVPLRLMYPQADVPVAQLSIQYPAQPASLIRIGRALAGLRAEGVLVLASGGLTHNLQEFGLAPRNAAPFAHVASFQHWMAEKLAAGDEAALADYRAQAPQAARVHPTDDHLLPLFVALGAAGPGWRARRLWDGVEYGMLAMDAYSFG